MEIALLVGAATTAVVAVAQRAFEVQRHTASHQRLARHAVHQIARRGLQACVLARSAVESIGDEGGVDRLVVVVTEKAVGHGHEVVVALRHRRQGHQVAVRQVIGGIGQLLPPLLRGGQGAQGVQPMGTPQAVGDAVAGHEAEIHPPHIAPLHHGQTAAARRLGDIVAHLEAGGTNLMPQLAAPTGAAGTRIGAFHLQAQPLGLHLALGVGEAQGPPVVHPGLHLETLEAGHIVLLEAVEGCEDRIVIVALEAIQVEPQTHLVAAVGIQRLHPLPDCQHQRIRTGPAFAEQGLYQRAQQAAVGHRHAGLANPYPTVVPHIGRPQGFGLCQNAVCANPQRVLHALPMPKAGIPRRVVGDHSVIPHTVGKTLVQLLVRLVEEHVCHRTVRPPQAARQPAVARQSRILRTLAVGIVDGRQVEGRRKQVAPALLQRLPILLLRQGVGRGILPIANKGVQTADAKVLLPIDRERRNDEHSQCKKPSAFHNNMFVFHNVIIPKKLFYSYTIIT